MAGQLGFKSRPSKFESINESSFSRQLLSNVFWGRCAPEPNRALKDSNSSGHLHDAGIKVGPVFLLHLGSSFQISYRGISN
jgi:hypothetical protein